MTNIKERGTSKNSPAAKKAPPIKPLPADVLQIVRAQAKRMKGAELAERLGVSSSAVSQAVNDKFVGNVERFCLRVRGVFGGDRVTCPVLGDIDTKVCLDQQQRPVAYTNPMRVQLARACKGCAHNQRQQTAAPGDHHE
jgi:DNA-binding transcriptional regulator YdaS (Cro superfamily)